MVAYADADYASEANDRRSVSGGAMMCAGACVLVVDNAEMRYAFDH